MLQWENKSILAASFKAVGFVLVILYKFIIVPIIIPAVQHGIKHGWIFIPLGAVAAIVVHFILYELFYHGSTAIAHVLAVPVYVLCIYGGVKLMRWKQQKNERVMSIYISPDVPEELYEDDDYYD